MDIHLSEDARRFIADEVASGRYPSEDAVIDAALRRLRQGGTSASSGLTLEGDPLWGMFRDEPELIDSIVRDAMRDRQSVPLRVTGDE
jgi:Arc/MetJ-type ribon-helix-helix transcriptional regulator